VYPVLKHGAISHAVYGVGIIGESGKGRFNVLLIFRSPAEAGFDLFGERVPRASDHPVGETPTPLLGQEGSLRGYLATPFTAWE